MGPQHMFIDNFLSHSSMGQHVGPSISRSLAYISITESQSLHVDQLGHQPLSYPLKMGLVHYFYFTKWASTLESFNYNNWAPQPMFLVYTYLTPPPIIIIFFFTQNGLINKEFLIVQDIYKLNNTFGKKLLNFNFFNHFHCQQILFLNNPISPKAHYQTSSLIYVPLKKQKVFV